MQIVAMLILFAEHSFRVGNRLLAACIRLTILVQLTPNMLS